MLWKDTINAEDRDLVFQVMTLQVVWRGGVRDPERRSGGGVLNEREREWNKEA